MHNIFDPYTQTETELQRRIESVLAAGISSKENQDLLVAVLGMLDMTTLEGSDTIEKVNRLCLQATFSAIDRQYPDAAAVCVYPSLVRYARQQIDSTGIKVASVAGGFPAGQTGLNVKLEEIRFAVDEGADEIDTVISRGKLIENRENEVFDEIAAQREACGSKHMKVILETGELPSINLIRRASELAILAGADFIKTSTGKISAGATPVAFLVMLDTIREYLDKTGKSIGIKPAGGIRTPDQAQVYGRLLLDVMGDQWFRKDFFRIGASSLAGEIIKKLKGANIG